MYYTCKAALASGGVHKDPRGQPVLTRVSCARRRRKSNALQAEVTDKGGGSGGSNRAPRNPKSTDEDVPDRGNQQQPLLGKPSSQTLLEIFKATAMSVALYTMGTNLRAGLTGIGQGLNGIGPGLNGIGKGLSCVGQGPNCRAPPLTKVLALGMKTAENVSTTAAACICHKKGMYEDHLRRAFLSRTYEE